MNNKGTALIITLVYLIITSIICTAVLFFSSRHYGLTSQRIERSLNLYYSESGLYSGIMGTTGTITVFPDISDPRDPRYNITVAIDAMGGNVKSRRNWSYNP
jgi:hypothetical protein